MKTIWKSSFILMCALILPFTIQASHNTHHNCGHAKYSLSDFEGNWVYSLASVGGISGSTGLSASALAHVTLDNKGNGSGNFGSLVAYLGPIGSPFALDVVDVSGLVMTLVIEDSKLGTGTLTFSNPSVSAETLVFEFIATKKRGKVNKLFLNVVSETIPAFAGQAILERQET